MWANKTGADKLEGKISKQAISKYEKGQMMPDSSVIIALAKALSVKPEYFFRPFRVELAQINFRKKSKLTKGELNAIQEKAKYQLERYLELEDLLDCHVPFRNPVKDYMIHDYEAIEEAVIALRNAWNLGLNPLYNVYEMLENVGFKIIEIEGHHDFDGLSTVLEDDIPVLVVNKTTDVFRRRFTVLHELGHLLLNIPDNAERATREKYCNYFANAFLIPKEALIQEFGHRRHNIFIREMIEVKEYFGISVQALGYRLQQLGIVEKNWANRFWMYIKSDEDRRQEIGMGEYTGKESSERFQHLIYKAVAEEIISIGKAAELLNADINNVREELLFV